MLCGRRSNCPWHLVPAATLVPQGLCSGIWRRGACALLYATITAASCELTTVSSLNRVITTHLRSGDLHRARKVFDAMPIKTIVSWNTLLAGYSKKPGYLKEACDLFIQIPNPDVISFNTMLSCHFHNADVDGARRLFTTMPYKDSASWNSMITGFSRNGLMDEAMVVFSNMPNKNHVSWNAMVSGYVQIGNMDKAKEYFDQAPNKNDVVLQTAMITGYMSLGKVDYAEKRFGNMQCKNLVTWNAMVAGYIENKLPEYGLKLFRMMIRTGCIMPNPSSFSSALLGCSNLSALALGRQIHQLSCKSQFCFDPTVRTSLLSMYSKCGGLSDARRLFDEMQQRDVVAWNAMISGYAQHGKGTEAIDLFHQMKVHSVQPDWITFIGVLTACNHAGMVQLGMHYFNSMARVYGVEHRSDHYSCMVDLLCRAGSLVEAADLICSMPFKPNEAVYGILLGACRMHKNLELAEFAANSLLELKPQSSGAYVQLANAYAAMNRWDDVSKIRRLMKANKVIKPPGYSWIEVRSMVHEFRSADRIHPQLDLIHQKLNELETRMKQAGYIPDLSSSSHYVCDEVKELILSQHSEKLAIAFGLISMPQGTTIRVFKNLRVCGDCHTATKFISQIEQREIVVRDTTRFHHFKNGGCSCGDYW